MDTDLNRLKTLLIDFGIGFEEHAKGIDVDGVMNNGDNGHFKIDVNNKIKDVECPYCDANIPKRKM